MTFDEALLTGAGGSIYRRHGRAGADRGGTTGTVVLDVAAGPGVDVQADAVGIADQGVTSADR
jgi:hypothetical protein